MKTIILMLLMGLSLDALAENSLKDVQFKDLNNRTTTLAQHTTASHKVYVKAWASWCPICLVGLDEIDELSADKARDFDVITVVSPDKLGEKSTQDFIDWYKGLGYKNIIVLLDEKGEVLKRGNIRGYPSNLLLDKELNVIKTIAGHLNKAEIKEVMEKDYREN